VIFSEYSTLEAFSSNQDVSSSKNAWKISIDFKVWCSENIILLAWTLE
jgi:hypothetical protein